MQQPGRGEVLSRWWDTCAEIVNEAPVDPGVQGHFLGKIGGTCWSSTLLASIFSTNGKVGHFQEARVRIGLGQKF